MNFFDRINKPHWIKLIASSLIFGNIISWLLFKDGGQLVLLGGKTLDRHSMPIQIVWVVFLSVFISFLFLVVLYALKRLIDLNILLITMIFVICIFLIFPFSPNVFTLDTLHSTPCCIDSDTDFFYSIFHIMARGEKLYTEVFEIKDPVFFYTNMIAYSMMGQKGPLVLELLLSIIMICSLGIITSRLKIHWIGTVTLLILFAYFGLAPPGFVLVHTYHQPISIFLLIICLTFFRRTPVNGILCGVLFSLMVFSKLLSLLLLPCILFGIAIFDQPGQYFSIKKIKRNITYFCIGTITATLTLFLVMVLRGEFMGFILMNKIQFIYSQNKEIMPDLPNLTVIQFLVNNYGWMFIAFITLEILFGLSVSIKLFSDACRIKNRSDIPESHTKSMNVCFFAMLTIAGIFGLSYFTHMWVHHLQPLSIAISIGILPIMVFPWKKEQQINIFLNILLIIIVILMLLPPYKLIQQTVGAYEVKTSRLIRQQPYYPQNDEINSILNKLAISKGRELNYAVLQHNYPGWISVILPDNLHFRCTFLAQYPILYPYYDEFINCLHDKNLDVIFKMSSPYIFNMPEIETGILDTLKNYHMIIHFGDYDIFIRNEG